MLTPLTGVNGKNNIHTNSRVREKCLETTSCFQEIVSGVFVSYSDSPSLSVSSIKAKQQISVSPIFHYSLSWFIPQGSSLMLIFCLFLLSIYSWSAGHALLVYQNNPRLHRAICYVTAKFDMLHCVYVCVCIPVRGVHLVFFYCLCIFV